MKARLLQILTGFYL